MSLKILDEIVQNTESEQKRNYRLLNNLEKLISEDCAVLVSDQLSYKAEQEEYKMMAENN